MAKKLSFYVLATTLVTLGLLILSLFCIAVLRNHCFHTQPLQLLEFERCPPLDGLPESSCIRASACLPRMRQERNIGLIACGYVPSDGQALLCCPLDTSFSAKTNLSSSTVRNLPSIFPYTHLAALGYINSQSLDEIIYRCTAVILSPTQVLATSNCVGSKLIERPNQVAFDSPDLRLYIESESEIEIQHTASYKNNLTVFTLDKPIDTSQNLLQNVTVAQLCDVSDLNDAPRLYAVGYAQQDGTNCAFFKTPLVKLNDCGRVLSSPPVAGPNVQGHFLCAEAQEFEPQSRQKNDCIRCLTASTSVLHVIRTDGSFCVAGIATPTSTECIESVEPVQFTLITGNILEELAINDQSSKTKILFRSGN